MDRKRYEQIRADMGGYVREGKAPKAIQEKKARRAKWGKKLMRQVLHLAFGILLLIIIASLMKDL